MNYFNIMHFNNSYPITFTMKQVANYFSFIFCYKYFHLSISYFNGDYHNYFNFNNYITNIFLQLGVFNLY